MKNLKNTVATIGLMAVLGMATTTANAGILISDRSTPAPTMEQQQQQCRGANSENWASTIRGLIVAGAHRLFTPNGILISDGSTSFDDSACQQDNTVTINGILISD
ncbi:MAG: hypothetical protein H0U87_00895 [Acidobacteria bacterium]|nr:hypothetical protein [Acidobacteriota bacterium]